MAARKSNFQPPGAGLGVHSARGFIYLLSGTMTAKVVSVLANVALAYLLTESDWGVIGLAYTVTIFIQVIEQGGVGDILVQRGNFRRWAVPAFWLAFALGTASMLLIEVSAPIAARIYDDPRLVTLLAILAPGSFFNALTVVPRAKMLRELRFRALAALNVLNLATRLTLTVVFAALGFGAYSFAIPVPIVNALTAVFLWWWLRPPWSMNARLRHWRYLIGDSTRILTAELQRAILDQSDYMLLGVFRSVNLVGVYYLGFTFSIQLLQLFSNNLMNILFPAFTKLNDRPQAQLQAFLNAQRILAMVGVSACLIQAAAAEPLTMLVLPSKWEPAIIVMQILSVGMAMRMVAGSSYALLKSQGRFRAILWNRWGFVTLQLTALLLVLGWGGGIAAVAVVVAIVASLIGPISFYIAVRPYGAGWRTVTSVLFRPTTCAAVSAGTAWGLSYVAARAGCDELVQLSITLLVAVAINAILARVFIRPVWDDLWSRLWRVLRRRAAAATAAATDDPAASPLP